MAVGNLVVGMPRHASTSGFVRKQPCLHLSPDGLRRTAPLCVYSSSTLNPEISRPPAPLRDLSRERRLDPKPLILVASGMKRSPTPNDRATLMLLVSPLALQRHAQAWFCKEATCLYLSPDGCRTALALCLFFIKPTRDISAAGSASGLIEERRLDQNPSNPSC